MAVPLRTPVETAFQAELADGSVRVASARVGHQLGIDVRDSRPDSDRLGAAVHTKEFFEGAGAAGVPNFRLQAFARVV